MPTRLSCDVWLVLELIADQAGGIGICLGFDIVGMLDVVVISQAPGDTRRRGHLIDRIDRWPRVSGREIRTRPSGPNRTASWGGRIRVTSMPGLASHAEAEGRGRDVPLAQTGTFVSTVTSSIPVCAKRKPSLPCITRQQQ